MKKTFKFTFLTFFFLSVLYSFQIAPSIGKNGAVVCSKVNAANIGVDILESGGNAIDAAVAVGFALSVEHPSAGNIGGGGFMVIRFANGNVTTIDFREKAPKLAYEQMFLDSLGNVDILKSRYSSQSAGVPGSVYGLGYAHEKYGTMPWSSLLYPSINLAKYGFPLDYHNMRLLNSARYRNMLGNDIESKKIFVKDKDYQLGDIFVQKNLSKTLLRIAKYGYMEFYTGRTSDFIIECMNRSNGIITKKDLNDYKAIEREPIKFNYRGYNFYSMPLPSSGGITIANIFNQLENVDLSKIPFHSSEHIHLLSEIEKRAYADRAEYLGDEDFVYVPVDSLISKNYAKHRFKMIDSNKSTVSSTLNDMIKVDFESEETTHYSVVDKYGNAVSVTMTINGSFGSGITVDHAGFLLNNEMDDFSSKPNVPNQYGLIGNDKNAIRAEKRMLSSMTPTIVEDKSGELFLVLGSPGGSTIITTVAQIAMNVIDYNMTLNEAVQSKRFHHQWIPDIIQLEERSLSKETIINLQNMNHKLRYRSAIGEANCIMFDKELNLYHAVPDLRRGAVSRAY